jgi:hypothetical protein
MLLAQCCENDVVPYVLPFVEENINAEMWQRRDAAVMAFGKAGFRVLSPGQTRKHCCGNICDSRCFLKCFPVCPPVETLLRKQNLLPEKQKCFLANSETLMFSYVSYNVS